MKRIRNAAPVFALVLSVIAAGCDDDPVGHEEEHLEPVGMVISAGGVDLVTVDGSTVTGSLSVANGQETAHLSVAFVDEDGDRFTPDEADEWLRVTIAAPTIADFEQDEAGEFGGHLHGLSVGSTTAVFEVMHGAVNSASAHPDYTSPSVPVTIN